MISKVLPKPTSVLTSILWFTAYIISAINMIISIMIHDRTKIKPIKLSLEPTLFWSLAQKAIPIEQQIITNNNSRTLIIGILLELASAGT